ncbi:hypothetical protein [Streptomyces sp. XM4193]|nr:hypothetical protein [Streptomyces sp. XM4193]
MSTRSTVTSATAVLAAPRTRFSGPVVWAADPASTTTGTVHNQKSTAVR